MSRYFVCAMRSSYPCSSCGSPGLCLNSQILVPPRKAKKQQKKNQTGGPGLPAGRMAGDLALLKSLIYAT